MKKILKGGERSETYLTQVCRLPQSLESFEIIQKNKDEKQKLSASTVALTLYSQWKPHYWLKAPFFPFLMAQKW